MAMGLEVGLGDLGADTVFRRSFSVLILGACIDRDNAVELLPAGKLMEWGDRVATWYVRERDLRGYVEGKGWAHAAAHGADALAALARSRHFALPELTVLLDVMADRLLLPSGNLLVTGEPDRMAAAVMAVLGRNLVPLSILEPWVSRLAHAADRPAGATVNPYPQTLGVQSFLRALHLQLSVGAARPDVRPDLLLALVDALRATNRQFLQ